jgi:hypothetical protein
MTTAVNVLEAIKTLHSKQILVNKSISADTLILMLNISAKELLPLIEELCSKRDIVYHESKSLRANRGIIKYGTITLC